MTEPTNPPSHTVEAPDDEQEERDTFDREYVSKLRGEAAEARTALKEAKQRGDVYFEQLKTRTAEGAVAGILQSPTDLPADDERYYDADGFPSVEGYQLVARELVAAKPYLASVGGDIHQGVIEQDTVPSFGDAIRGALH